MRHVRIIFFWLGVTLLAGSTTLYTGCTTLGPGGEPPVVILSDLRPLEMTLFEQRFQVRLRIQNPNQKSLDITGMHYTLYLQDRVFAHGISDQQVIVPAFGEAVIDSTVASRLDNILEQLFNRGKDTAGNLKYRLEGMIAINKRLGRIPFESTGEFHFPAHPARPTP